VAQNTWLGKQRNDPNEASRLGCTSVGRKETTGFTANNYRNVSSADVPGRFVTDYQMRFSVLFTFHTNSMKDNILLQKFKVYILQTFLKFIGWTRTTSI
jgi:Protein phosphatase 1 regulatory subunit 32